MLLLLSALSLLFVVIAAVDKLLDTTVFIINMIIVASLGVIRSSASTATGSTASTATSTTSTTADAQSHA